ncbi:cytochrome C biogenesis protein CcmH [Sandarakinorhabdus cyanobacteriorum]|uniref:Cytochrome c-type biogenesis protein n=1 Tax=Sandarakinorhabdus cyanobacteriorum TaxID=1981098 RepID=A0A255YNU8_9SPHN|nr:cytochrome C biogenesis protein CcmH [Sandarakinorhabdus cyanobacteriorum]
MSILPLWGRCRPQGGGGGGALRSESPLRPLGTSPRGGGFLASHGSARKGNGVAWLLLTLILAAPAAAVMPDEMLPDPAQEQRARTISKDLRCVVCQNQSIDDSDAPLARDLRLLVREQIAKGKSDAEVRDYVVARYGNFVLLKPPVEGDTLLLWAGPFAVLILGGVGVALWQRRRPAATTDAPLSDAERAELDRLS